MCKQTGKLGVHRATGLWPPSALLAALLAAAGVGEAGDQALPRIHALRSSRVSSRSECSWLQTLCSRSVALKHAKRNISCLTALQAHNSTRCLPSQHPSTALRAPP